MPFSHDAFKTARSMSLQKFGDKHPESVFYVVYREKLGSGFFSNVFHVLGHLHIAQTLGLIPVIDMRHFPSLYNEDEPIQGSSNAWEYYFEQPARYSLGEVYESRNVAFCDGKFPWEIYDNSLAMPLARRYLRPKQYVNDLIEAFFRDYFAHSSHILGVHFRGQEQKNAPCHPACPTCEQMISKTKYLLDTYPIDKIFLVTEEQAYLDIFVQTFGERIVFTNAFRTYDINAYHIRPYPREQHMFRLGLDVLVDTMLLARTQYLLAGGKDGVASGSNVSQMAQVLNGNQYTHVELIDNGINEGPSLLSRVCGKIKRIIKGQ
ncbi:hypothetical protein FACS1894206_08690 [Deltaproteobacteria bacterium]|nr:hypothetical protein FACS1894206_08690 [Deltaproteobacteria bacterium]